MGPAVVAEEGEHLPPIDLPAHGPEAPEPRLIGMHSYEVIGEAVVAVGGTAVSAVEEVAAHHGRFSLAFHAGVPRAHPNALGDPEGRRAQRHAVSRHSK